MRVTLTLGIPRMWLMHTLVQGIVLENAFRAVKGYKGLLPALWFELYRQLKRLHNSLYVPRRGGVAQRTLATEPSRAHTCEKSGAHCLFGFS